MGIKLAIVRRSVSFELDVCEMLLKLLSDQSFEPQLAAAVTTCLWALALRLLRSGWALLGRATTHGRLLRAENLRRGLVDHSLKLLLKDPPGSMSLPPLDTLENLSSGVLRVEPAHPIARRPMKL